MGYVVDWKLTAPESFNPSNDSEVQEKIEELQNLGYDVDVTAQSDGLVEWTKRGFEIDRYHWYQDRNDPNVYRYSELTLDAQEMFEKVSNHYDGLFILDGTNPDGGCFRVYCKEGNSYSVSPQFPEFDESKLQEED